MQFVIRYFFCDTYNCISLMFLKFGSDLIYGDSFGNFHRTSSKNFDFAKTFVKKEQIRETFEFRALHKLNREKTI